MKRRKTICRGSKEREREREREKEREKTKYIRERTAAIGLGC